MVDLATFARPELSILAFLVSNLFVLHVFDPAQALSLRIDEERPALSTRRDDAILHTEGVGGKALNVPVAHHRRLGQELTQLEHRRTRHQFAAYLSG